MSPCFVGLYLLGFLVCISGRSNLLCTQGTSVHVPRVSSQDSREAAKCLMPPPHTLFGRGETNRQWEVPTLGWWVGTSPTRERHLGGFRALCDITLWHHCGLQVVCFQTVPSKHRHQSFWLTDFTAVVQVQLFFFVGFFFLILKTLFFLLINDSVWVLWTDSVTQSWHSADSTTCCLPEPSSDERLWVSPGF